MQQEVITAEGKGLTNNFIKNIGYFGYLSGKIGKYFLPVSIGLFSILMQIPWQWGEQGEGAATTAISHWTFGDFLVVFLLFVFFCQIITPKIKQIFNGAFLRKKKLKQPTLKSFFISCVTTFTYKLKTKLDTWNSENWRNWVLQILNEWRWTIWLVIFTLWMTFSLYQGYLYDYFPTAQAALTAQIASLLTIPTDILINKYFGWWMMMSYFVLGGLLTKHKDLLKIFLKSLFISSAVINTLYVVIYCTQNNYILLNDPVELGLFSTFMVLIQIPFIFQNRNFSTKTSVVYHQKIFSNLSHLLVIIPNLISIFFFASKITLLAFGLGLWCFSIHGILASYLSKNNIKPKYIFLAILLFSIVGYQILNKIDFEKINSYSVVEKFYKNLNEDLLERKSIVTDALKLWKEKPFIGIGLGKLSYIDNINYTDNKHYKDYNGMQSSTHKINITPVTLLTEIGLFGVIIYVWFIITSGRYLFRKKYAGEANELLMAMILVLIALIAASFTIEVFYQRYIWLLWGMALTHSEKKIMK